ncbi:patatin-like phospholipase family protein [Nocardia elegans]|uniref:Patatin-like phospholipase family protein n=1 Tax=Nocardia elegans TaxID=300029 RepID=A0ABW6TGN8_9NOCA|nr:patatin-like phospholipase family protein [Nocardia elegans]MBF6446577.1 patatin-like phospholipase family protein [Nocardia elegans]
MSKLSDKSLAEPRPYRLLSLPGGGVRGVFQARFLQRLEERMRQPSAQIFDGIAATSTGALVGLALACGKPASNIYDLYQDFASEIFKQRRFGMIRKGSRYRPGELVKQIEKQLGDKRVGDIDVDIFITSSIADNYEGRLFTKIDRDARLADIALASAAAPTYFPPRTVGSDTRTYMDGGLWANNPCQIALQHLLSGDSAPTDIVVFSLCTGRIPKGETLKVLSKARPLSMTTLQFLADVVPALQEWQVRTSIEKSLPDQCYIEINPILTKWIALDDYRMALDVLPGLSDAEFDKNFGKLQALLDYRPVTEPWANEIAGVPWTTLAGVAIANITAFIPSRKFYGEFREGRESITAYISSAKEDLTLVSVNLMTGDTLESILETFQEMLSRKDSRIRITLSLLNPRAQHLMEAVAPNIGRTGAELEPQIQGLVERVMRFRSGLTPEMRGRFKLVCHNTLPSASAIMIDVNSDHGKIQLETKAYKTPMIQSFGFEVSAGSEFYSSLRRAYLELIADGEEVS